MLEKYMRAITTGRVNGYGFIDRLTEEQIGVLCGIATAVSKKSVQTREELKDFTLNYSRANVKVFDRYVDNAVLAYNNDCL